MTAIQNTVDDPFIVAAKMMALKAGVPIIVTRDPHTGNFKVMHTTSGLFTFIEANKLHGKSPKRKLERFCSILIRTISAIEEAVADPKQLRRGIYKGAVS